MNHLVDTQHVWHQSEPSVATLLERFYWRVVHQPEQIAYQFLDDQPVPVAQSSLVTWTYRELYERVQVIAAGLAQQFKRQGRSSNLRFQAQPAQSFGSLSEQPVLLVYPPGLELIAAFLGCLAVGVIAVPVPPPRRHESFSRWQHILTDASVTGILTSQALVKEIEPLVRLSSNLEQQASLQWLVTDAPASKDVAVDLALLRGSGKESTPLSALLGQQRHARETVAFLQYTSGSTSQPKGVKVTHANLAHNLQQIQQAFGHSEQTRCVIWLPPYHDMGLIGGILQPLYGGYPVTLMSPASFLRRPTRWLEAISHFGATTSGGPNFAYEYCLQKVSPQGLESLNLATWKVAFTGAEPVQASTLSRFCEVFSSCGFQSSAFYPCYGLAEATLFVSGGSPQAVPKAVLLDRQALFQNRIKRATESVAGEKDAAEFVSCGQVVNQHIRVVNPKTGIACQASEVGEIWLAGKSVAAGYWNRPEETQATFAATVSGESFPQFLRTGDLGFLHQGELFITGRLKEVMILRGRNYYPQDIELKAQAAHPALAPVSAAFSISGEGTEKLVVVQEVTRSAVRSLSKEALTPEEIFAAIRAALSREFALSVAGITLLKPGQVPRTTSGKIQRQRCKQLFEKSLQKFEHADGHQATSNRWDTIAQWTTFSPCLPGDPSVSQANVDCPDPNAIPSATEQQTVESLLHWLRQTARHQINSRQMDERRCLSPDLVLAFGNQGLLGMQVPQVYGGLALSHQSTLKIIQQLGAIDLTLALFVGLNNVLGIRPILRYGSAELKEKWLPRLATGRELAAFALTETGAGSHPASIASRAIPTEMGWQIQGEKIWSGSAAWAGILNVFVQQVDADGIPLGITGFAIEKESPGLRQGPEALTMGMRGMIQNTVFLDQVPVSTRYQLGRTGDGMSVAQDAMGYGRLAIAAACVGGMKRCAQLILRYGQQRHISTGKLLNNPVLLTRLSWLRNATTAIESLVTLLSTRLDADLPVPEELYAACKIMGPELYWQATDYLMQALGGRGYIETNLAPQMMRDARVLRIFEGPTEAIVMHLGARISGQPDMLKAFFTSFNADIGVEKTSEMLFEAADWVLEQYLDRSEESHATPKTPSTQRKSPFTEPRTARYQANYKIGQLGAWAITLTALQATHAPQMTVKWAQQQLNTQITTALEIDPNESAALSAEQTAEWIQAYQGGIGEVDSQAAVGELDSLLRPKSVLSSQAAEIPTDRGGHTAASTSLLPVMGKTAVDFPASTASEKALTQWMVIWIAEKLTVDPMTVNPHQAFADYGLDSVMAVELAEDLSQHLALSTPLEATLAWNFPTISALASHLADITQQQRQSQNLQETTQQTAQQSFDQSSGQISQHISEHLDHLTDDELAQVLSAELAAVRRRNP